jgi:aryl-alcohol dehydrogenase-like predicted oxidoreductase
MEMAVIMRALGRTGIQVSPIGLGCWQFSQGKGLTGSMWSVLDQDTTDAVVGAALEGAVTWFDTAEAYGDGRSELTLSTALRNLGVQPDAVMVATKWLPILRTAANIPRTIDERLACLQGYPVGLYQVHIPWSLSSIKSQMRELAALVHEGKIGSVGVSNFSARQMEKASRALQEAGLVLASNQVPVSLLDRRIERNGLLEAARQAGITLIAYSPLAQGLLSGKFHADPDSVRTLPSGRRSRLSPASRAFRTHSLARTKPLIELLRTIGKSHGVSVSQVSLAWLIAHYGETVVAIPGASSPKQSAENAAAMELRLTESELSRINEMSAAVAKR